MLVLGLERVERTPEECNQDLNDDKDVSNNRRKIITLGKKTISNSRSPSKVVTRKGVVRATLALSHVFVIKFGPYDLEMDQVTRTADKDQRRD